MPMRLEEVARLGSKNGGDALTDVNAIVFDSQDRIYITQPLVPFVSVFAPNGRLERTIGRAGEGPGEFRLTASWMGWRGDTLWVLALNKVTLFPPGRAGAIDIVFRIPVPEEGSVLIPRAVLADGSVLGGRLVNNQEVYFTAKPAVPMRRFTRDGTLMDTIAMLEQTGRYFRIMLDRQAYEVSPFHAMLHNSLLNASEVGSLRPDGSAIVTVGNVHIDEPGGLRGRLVGGRARGSFDLFAISIAGDTLSRRTITFTPQPISGRDARRHRQDFEDYVAKDFEGGPGRPNNPMAAARMRKAAADGFETPRYYPPVRRVLAGYDGSTWLLREDVGDVDRWEIYSPVGQLLGEVQIGEGRSAFQPWAPRMKILRASSSDMWGMTLGESDVPLLQHFRIRGSC